MSLRSLFPSLLLLFAAVPAWAHKPSDSYLTLRQEDGEIRGQWEIALRDLEGALGLDADQDGAITWGELRARHADVAAYALGHLSAEAAGAPCATTVIDQLVERHGDGAYSVLRFRLDCPGQGEIALDYRLFFDLDPSHRGLLRLETASGVETAVLAPDASGFELAGQPRSGWEQFADYWREGVWHIWIGFDHLLFLFALLLPAVLVRDEKGWMPARSFRAVLVKIAGIVTAFTIAHSLTLMVAVLGWVSLPSRWVESAIAATVIVAALNNLRPFLGGRAWVVAFCLGLIHGFGFAGVLAELGLPAGALARALVGFNLGVETGQLAIVLAVLPFAFWVRATRVYRFGVLGVGSVIVALLAGTWLLERSLDLRLPWL